MTVGGGNDGKVVGARENSAAYDGGLVEAWENSDARAVDGGGAGGKIGNHTPVAGAPAKSVRENRQMAIREDQLNGRIATIIRECVSGTQWNVAEENDGTLATSGRRPDILITRRSPEPPIVIENEYSAARVEGDCLNKLGQQLQPALGGQTIHTVIGVLSPQELQDADNGDAAEAMLRNGALLQYVAYTGTPEQYDRFPKSGFITGSVRNLVEFVRPAAEPADLIRQAADTLADGAAVAARAIVDAAGLNTATGVSIAEKLRQPWPTGASENARQEQANREARLQTANMAATIIINAMAYQQNLDGYSGIKGLAQVRAETTGNHLTKDAVIAGFDRILDVNFWPIFHVAKELLLQIPAGAANAMMEQMASAADGIIEAVRHNDIAGTLFQRLIADRKTLKTYYTTPEATTLMAHLAIPEEIDWANPETLKAYQIADYACGSGGIMLASYQRVRDLHRLHGGNPDELHQHMMQECLTACDIMPAAVHLTASLLSSAVPTVPYEGTRCILFPFGGQRKTAPNGQLVTDADGRPVKMTNSRGKPIVHLGSMALLNSNETSLQAVLPPDEQAALGAHGESRGIYVPMAPFSQSLVAMNPPFTTPTKHAPFGSSDHVEPKNPAFAAFGTTDAEQTEMKRLERRLGGNTISDGNAGLGTTFTAIANNMVRPGGRIALILPTSAMMGGSYDAEKEQAYSWQRLRNLLLDNYDQIVVVSIAQPDKKDSAFSADSDFADCMVIARRLSAGAKPSRRAHFVNLKDGPATKLEAQETARAVKTAIANTVTPDTWNRIQVGDEEIGFVSYDSVGRHEKWTTIRISEPTLAGRAKSLAGGRLHLPQRAGVIEIPITKAGNIAQVGPVHRDITGRINSPFSKRDGYQTTHEYPMLWNHSKPRQNSQRCMLADPDSHGEVRESQEEAAERMWNGSATHLHVNGDFQFNANATAAAYTERASLGGRAWPTLKLASPQHEKAMCVWLNSALGIIGYWMASNRTQNGRGGITVTAIPDLPALDVTRLSATQLDAAALIFDDLQAETLLPANEAWRDPVRQELDRRLLTDVLGIDDNAVEQLGILRRQWCSEPTVTATKRTGPVG